jgi:hypothetical protein
MLMLLGVLVCVIACVGVLFAFAQVPLLGK